MALAYEDPRNARLTVSDDEIPILDLAPLRAGEDGALERLGERMRHACENVGFYFAASTDRRDTSIKTFRRRLER